MSLYERQRKHVIEEAADYANDILGTKSYRKHGLSLDEWKEQWDKLYLDRSQFLYNELYGGLDK